VLQRAGNLLKLWLHQLVVRVFLALAPLDLLDKFDFLPLKYRRISCKIVMKNQVPTKFATPEKYTASPTDLLSDAVELVPPV
jgi:hypothetical protein